MIFRISWKRVNLFKRLFQWFTSSLYGNFIDDYENAMKDRDRLIDQLRQSAKEYRRVFENAGTATVIMEEDGTISMANAEFERLSGYKKGEIENKLPLTQFVTQEDLELMKGYHADRRKTDGFPAGEGF
jgi:PAS domain-containing protein